MKIFDSNVWIAYLNKDDSQHQKASRIFEETDESILVPEYVIIEVATILKQIFNKSVADNFISRVLNTDGLEVLYIQEELFIDILNYFQFAEYKGLSFVDVVLLYFSKNNQLITFDQKLDKFSKKQIAVKKV